MTATGDARRLVLLALAALVAAAAGCEADLDEGCVGGACGGASAGASTTTSGGGGAAADAGAHDAAACSPPPPTGDFPPAVAKALANCRRCHVPADRGPITPAPFPLLRFEDVVAEYGHEPIWKRMAPAIRSGFMPAAPPKLAPEDEATLLQWLDACAPPAAEGAGCDPGEGCEPP